MAITLCLFFLSRALNTSPKVPCWVENHEIQMLLNVFLSSPVRSLPAFHTWTLLHSRGSRTARCIGPCIIQLSFCANIYSYELCLHACKYDFFLSNDMIGLLAVHFGVG